MLVYILLLAFIILGNFFFEKRKNGEKIYLILTFLILTLISGLRNYTVGVDTVVYVNFFENLKNISFQNLNLLRYEYGFSLFCKVISIITDDYHVFLFLVSAFINFSVVHFINNNSRNKFLSLLMFVLCNYYFSYMNIMRQALAISIVLFSLEFLKKNKLLQFTILVILASQFHFSAIICLVLIFLNKFEFSRRHLPVITLLSILAFVYGNTVFAFFASLSPRLSSYIGTDYSSNNYFGALFEALIIVVQMLFGFVVEKSRYKKEDKQHRQLFINGGIEIATIISILTMKATIFNRFLPYFSIFTIIWTPNALENINDKKNKGYFSFITVFMFFLYFIVICKYRPEWYGTIPYKFLN